jgi:hypothetical protein
LPAKVQIIWELRMSVISSLLLALQQQNGKNLRRKRKNATNGRLFAHIFVILHPLTKCN